MDVISDRYELPVPIKLTDEDSHFKINTMIRKKSSLQGRK